VKSKTSQFASIGSGKEVRSEGENNRPEKGEMRIPKRTPDFGDGKKVGHGVEGKKTVSNNFIRESGKKCTEKEKNKSWYEGKSWDAGGGFGP